MLENVYFELVENVFAYNSKRIFPIGTYFEKKNCHWNAVLPNGKRKYLGQDTPELRSILRKAGNERIEDLQHNLIANSLIKNNGYPVPNTKTCDVLSDLADNGFFRMGGVLVGTLAYQCYYPMLKLDWAMANDIDVLQVESISVAIPDDLEQNFENILQRHDICQCKEESVRFLIQNAMKAVILAKNPIPVFVPRPERYCVHKMIISTGRIAGSKKATKYLVQASILMKYFLEHDRELIFTTINEAMNLDPRWKKALWTFC